MKIRKLFKRAAAFALAAVTALSAVPATTAFAAGDIGTISFTHTYDGAGNAIRYNSSANIGGHTAGGTGEYKYRNLEESRRLLLSLWNATGYFG
ncbi:hypothetical protein [Acutalibacter intestini]|uniref:hypothetical protein n=1 Tax=Acutalibacter intestini TaxID=3093659 RepID=UPI003460EF2C